MRTYFQHYSHSILKGSPHSNEAKQKRFETLLIRLPAVMPESRCVYLSVSCTRARYLRHFHFSDTIHTQPVVSNPKEVPGMPNWKAAMTHIVKAVEEAAREANARQQTGRGRQFTAKRATGQKRCLFWSCNTPIRQDYIVCYDHYEDMVDGLIDECPSCNRAKYTEYDVCLDCFNHAPKRPTQARASGTKEGYKWYRPEYSPAWDKKDSAATEFFVYILKLNGGTFYAGQTRELRERLSEHKDGRVKTTAGKTPQLVWFATVPSRNAATSLEVELKKLVDTNPREIRRMVVRFRDHVRELDYS